MCNCLLVSFSQVRVRLNCLHSWQELFKFYYWSRLWVLSICLLYVFLFISIMKVIWKVENILICQVNSSPPQTSLRYWHFSSTPLQSYAVYKPLQLITAQFSYYRNWRLFEYQHLKKSTYRHQSKFVFMMEATLGKKKMMTFSSPYPSITTNHILCSVGLKH